MTSYGRPECEGEGWRPALSEPLRRHLLELGERVFRRTSRVRNIRNLGQPHSRTRPCEFLCNHVSPDSCLKTRLIVRERSSGREIRHEIEHEKDADDVMSNCPTRVTRDSHWHHNWTSGRQKKKSCSYLEDRRFPAR